MIAKTPEPPYYAVIFSSITTETKEGYTEMADFILTLAEKQEGFLGIESARNQLGITVSYWKNLEAIKTWKAQSDHQIAQKFGKAKWYAAYKVRIAIIERDYNFEG